MTRKNENLISENRFSTGDGAAAAAADFAAAVCDMWMLC